MKKLFNLSFFYFVVNGKICIYGGIDLARQTPPTEQIAMLDTTTLVWSIPPLQDPNIPNLVFHTLCLQATGSLFLRVPDDHVRNDPRKLRMRLAGAQSDEPTPARQKSDWNHDILRILERRAHRQPGCPARRYRIPVDVVN